MFFSLLKKVCRVPITNYSRKQTEESISRNYIRIN